MTTVRIIIFINFINFVNIIIFMKQKYKTTIPITEDELKDFTVIKANLEQLLQKPLTIRATFSMLLQYLKKKIDSEDFKKEILFMEKRGEINKEETSPKEMVESEEKGKKQEKRSFFSQLFRKS